MRFHLYLARSIVVLVGIILHTLAWWLNEGQGGMIADLPNLYWQHAVGMSIAVIVVAVVGPLLLKGPAFVISLIRDQQSPLIDVIGLMFKIGIFIGVFALWIPWEFWFR